MACSWIFFFPSRHSTGWSFVLSRYSIHRRQQKIIIKSMRLRFVLLERNDSISLLWYLYFFFFRCVCISPVFNLSARLLLSTVVLVSVWELHTPITLIQHKMQFFLLLFHYESNRMPGDPLNWICYGTFQICSIFERGTKRILRCSHVHCQMKPNEKILFWIMEISCSSLTLDTCSDAHCPL